MIAEYTISGQRFRGKVTKESSKTVTAWVPAKPCTVCSGQGHGIAPVLIRPHGTGAQVLSHFKRTTCTKCFGKGYLGEKIILLTLHKQKHQVKLRECPLQTMGYTWLDGGYG